MKNVFFFLALIVLIVFASISGFVFSQSPRPSPAPQTINSYEFFWPITAGKKEGDSLYFLKILKENIRSAFIFDPFVRGDYEILLATKRIIEAEELLKEGKETLAETSFNKAYRSLLKASSVFEKMEKGTQVRNRIELNDRLSRLNIFLPTLYGLTNEAGIKWINTIHDRVTYISNLIN
ncbi:MAG: DUF5667 domain-containing protein [Candidatus Woesebacteria bacterium]|nr:DUF5667 domain-containing protein [Candidatus Woesebacteria bacterium]